MTENTHTIKVLIIDDDKDILEALEVALSMEGFDVRTASSSKQGFKEITQRRPDVILLDVLLSGEDGRVVMKKLKEKEETKSIPVIMISAHPTAQHSSLEAGANAFLAKPFVMEDLLHTITDYARG